MADPRLLRGSAALRWRDVDLAAGWLRVGEGKTDVGKRRVKMRGALRDVLVGLRAKAEHVDQDACVFGTRTGGRPSGDNVRSRVLNPAVARANKSRAKRDLPPCPTSSRPTRCAGRSHRCCTRSARTSRSIMREMGHTDPALTLKVYAQVWDRAEDAKEALRALVEGGQIEAAEDRNGERSDLASSETADDEAT